MKCQLLIKNQHQALSTRTSPCRSPASSWAILWLWSWSYPWWPCFLTTTMWWNANSLQELIDPLKLSTTFMPFSTSSTSLFSDSYIFSLIISHWSSSPKPSKTSRLLSLFLYKRYISFAWATISSKMSSSSASSSSWTDPLNLLLLNRGDLEPPLPALPTNLGLLLHLPAPLLLLAGPPLGLDDTPVLSWMWPLFPVK